MGLFNFVIENCVCDTDACCLQSFTPLVAVVDMATNQQPLEFLLDRELAFRDYSRLQPFQVSVPFGVYDGNSV
jgi:hypothetical protein